MADSADNNPQRSAADKERSRQLSRPVSGKEAAKTSAAGGRAQGSQSRRGQGRQGQRPQAGRGQAPRRADRAGTHGPGGRRPPTRRPSRPVRSSRNLFVWGAVALVVVIVGIVVAISQTSSNSTTKGLFYHSTPVPATVLNEITHVPARSYNAVGTGIAGAINAPRVVSGQKTLVVDGKPGMFSALGEFCPYCAAERWALITSLSRFGTFTGLKTMQSSPVDVYPRTQTFTFHTAKYTSPYLGADLLELYGQDKATGSHPVLEKPTKFEIGIMHKYDTGSTTHSGTIPFSDFGNKVFFAGASYNPNPLQGLSRTTIAASLKNPNNPITKLILGTSNYMSAAICNIDGGKPGAVCSSAGVKAAAKALKL